MQETSLLKSIVRGGVIATLLLTVSVPLLGVSAELPKAKEFQVEKRFAQKVKISWKKQRAADGYQIRILDKDKNLIRKDFTEKSTHVVRDLDPDTPYYLRVRSYTKFNGEKTFGEHSRLIKVKTKRSAAQKPRRNTHAYVDNFYNTYSKHFDNSGFVYKVPGYGVTSFREADTPRMHMSIASYYKYRAIDGDKTALKKIRKSIRRTDELLEARMDTSQSFEDALAQLMIISLDDQLPDLLSNEESLAIRQRIAQRAQAGIEAPDTSNRAALSAVYWQYIIQQLYQDDIISRKRFRKLRGLIRNKIDKVLVADVTNAGWYMEDEPRRFNPHYHLVTTFAFYAYADLTDSKLYYGKAEQMTNNLRKISFKNGMIEAAIGNRPVGLGAQFYLGTAMLNYAYGYSDYSTYANFASGDQFFSDARYPQRLEYHSTRVGESPSHHDDYAFSNITELALLLPSLKKFSVDEQTILHGIEQDTHDGEMHVVNAGSQITVNGQLFTQDENGRFTY